MSTTAQRQRSPEGARRGSLSMPTAETMASPLTTYYVLLGGTIALVLFGLVMVFSASSIDSISSAKPASAIFVKQLQYAIVGGVAAYVASRLSVRAWRRLAFPILLVAGALQLAVFSPLGYTVAGNTNWLKLGPVQMQPSELLKLALVLSGALILTNKQRLLGMVRHITVPFLIPVAAVAIALVLRGKDLGTALVMVGIVGAVLFAAGVPKKFFAAAGLAAVGMVFVLVTTSANRMGRITNWLSGTCTDPNGPCGQSVHGLYALADGGWWGVGLGGSREKWGWLAEPHNDFIFAIIGEELGLPGTLAVLFLFGALAWACYRLVVRSTDQFVRIASAAVMIWLLLQAMINIGGVIGLLPIIGVPLPLVSAGGSSLVTVLLAIGMLLSFARTDAGLAGATAKQRGARGGVRHPMSVLPGRRARRSHTTRGSR